AERRVHQAAGDVGVGGRVDDQAAQRLVVDPGGRAADHAVRAAVIRAAEAGDRDRRVGLADGEVGGVAAAGVVGVAGVAGRGPVVARVGRGRRGGGGDRAVDAHVVDREGAALGVGPGAGPAGGGAVRAAVVGRAGAIGPRHGHGRADLGDGDGGVAALVGIVGVAERPVHQAAGDVGVGGRVDDQAAQRLVVDPGGRAADHAVRAAVIRAAEA